MPGPACPSGCPAEGRGQSSRFLAPNVGQPDHSFKRSHLKSRVVLIVLRGWPGYQCPICTRQVQDYIAEAEGFAAMKARVVMVYPGPADNLKAHAKEFVQNKQWPKEYIYVTDPDFKMVNAYELRWDAPNETAYPATFVLGPQGDVISAKISHSHGDRTRASDILEELKRLPSQ